MAVDEGSAPVQQPMELPSIAGYFLRIIFSLVFIVGITYLAMRLLKRQNDLQQRQKSWIRIYDYQGLSANRGIYLMEILGNVYVMGVTEGQINILKEIDPNDAEWNDLKGSLEQSQEEILPWGLEKLIRESIDKFKPGPGQKKNNFQKQLDRQLGRTNRLYRQISKGGNDGE